MQTHQETTNVETNVTTPPRPRRWLGPVILVTLTAVLGGLLLAGVLPRKAQLKTLEVAASEKAASIASRKRCPPTPPRSSRCPAVSRPRKKRRFTRG